MTSATSVAPAASGAIQGRCPALNTSGSPRRHSAECLQDAEVADQYNAFLAGREAAIIEEIRRVCAVEVVGTDSGGVAADDLAADVEAGDGAVDDAEELLLVGEA